MVDAKSIAIGGLGVVGVGALWKLSEGNKAKGSDDPLENQLEEDFQRNEEWEEQARNKSISESKADEKANTLMDETLILADKYPSCKDKIEGQPLNGERTVIEENAFIQNTDEPYVTGYQRLKYWVDVNTMMLSCQADKENINQGLLGAAEEFLSGESGLLVTISLAAAGAVSLYAGAIVLGVALVGATVFAAGHTLYSAIVEHAPTEASSSDEASSTRDEIDDFSFTGNSDEVVESGDEAGTDYIYLQGSFRAAVAEISNNSSGNLQGEDVSLISTWGEKSFSEKGDGHTVSTDLMYEDNPGGSQVITAIADPTPVSPSYFVDNPAEGILLAWAYVATIYEGPTNINPPKGEIIDNALLLLPSNTGITDIDMDSVSGSAQDIVNNVQTPQFNDGE